MLAGGEKCTAYLLLQFLILVPAHGVQIVNSTYSNYKQTVNCTATKLFKPKSPERIVEIILEARRQGETVKAVGELFSSSRVICTKGFVLDMSGWNSIQIDEELMEVTVGAGVLLNDIYVALAERGFSLSVAGPRFSGISVGGLVGGGSFSSTVKHPPIYDQVTRMTMISGRGSLLVVTGSLLNAARVNLGWLGVVTNVTLPIVPRFKMSMKLVGKKDEFITSGEFMKDAYLHDAYRISWFSSIDSLVVYRGTIVDASDRGTGRIDDGFRSNEFTPDFANDTEISLTKAADGDTAEICAAEKANFEAQTETLQCCSLNVLIDSKDQAQNPTTGWFHDMTSTFCKENDCSWDYGGPNFDSESSAVAVPIKNVPGAFQAVKAILKRRNTCFVTAFGVQIFFLKKSSTYLSLSSGSDVAVFEFERPLRNNRFLAGFGTSAIREAVIALVSEFGGRPNWVYQHGLLPPFPSVTEMYSSWPLFKSTREQMGSEGVFDDELYFIVERKKRAEKTEYCEVLGSCNCSNDSHCGVGEVCRTRKFGETPFQFCDEVES